MNVDAPNLLLIGHNPALETLLAHLLADNEWRVLPPAGLVELELNVMADLRLPGGASLVARWSP
jgi:phosphohistidine phosphatase SixA